MTTEQYIITFFGIDTKYYTDDFVGRCWEMAADEEYGSTGVYVTGTVTTHSLICGEIRGCQLGKVGHCVSAVRNPVEVADSGTYKKSLINVINRTRSLLDNPNMSIIINEVEYFYFCQIYTGGGVRYCLNLEPSSADGQGVGGRVEVKKP